MSHPTAQDARELERLAGELHDHGRIVEIDATSVRFLFRLKDGAALVVGWRPVGLEIGLLEPGEAEPDDDGTAARRLDEITGSGLNPAALHEAFHLPENLQSVYCADPECGHVRGQHRKRGPVGYCNGVHVGAPGSNSRPCGCTGFVEPEADE